ncbi:hypothetical protein JNB88_08845 [Rhizobium cauense]|uniref:hypothetical protein n=1 Tax=Rhizobium cauense TaxID=1166683 RepID=UPI001C6EFE96|nr:hypothetical protein [Rhizobium cauense]MBW9113739.1 hypothetical protein [Rhizobium cauense]
MLTESEQLDGQFLVSTEPKFRSGWSQLQVGSLHVSLAPLTRVLNVYGADGDQIGVLVGTPIDLEGGRVITGRYTLPAALGEGDNIDEFVEEHIYKLSGSFLFLLSTAMHRRIYLDANGTISLVYDRDARIAGATAAALLAGDKYKQRFRARLYKALDVDNAGWFTGDLTAHTGINRLLCNHYLDLDTWAVTRHWPSRPLEVSSDPTLTCARIFERVRQTIEILARTGTTSVALTAGSDSRLLLSCCRDLLGEVSFATVRAPNADIDVACARRLATKFKLPHELLAYREATPKQAELWKLRAGHCVGGNNVKMHPSVIPLEGRYFVGGLGGEVGRGFLWLNARPDLPIDAKTLIGRLKLPQDDELLRSVAAWLAPISHFDAFLILDLAYIELRMSSWGFCDSYVKPKQQELHPMISRANYADMLSLPPDVRRKGHIYLQQIERSWKEISEIPINKYGNYRDVLTPALTAIRNPKRAYRKARQLLGARA